MYFRKSRRKRNVETVYLNPHLVDLSRERHTGSEKLNGKEFENPTAVSLAYSAFELIFKSHHRFIMVPFCAPRPRSAAVGAGDASAWRRQMDTDTVICRRITRFVRNSQANSFFHIKSWRETARCWWLDLRFTTVSIFPLLWFCLSTPKWIRTLFTVRVFGIIQAEWLH